MIEVLEQRDEGTCANCGGRIVQYHGDLLGLRWSHDTTGRAECPGSTYAEPSTQTGGETQR